MSEKMSREYRRGARDEAAAIVRGMTEDGHAVYDYVQVCAQQGLSADRIVADVTVVFTAGWPLRERIALAWRLVTP